MSSDPSGLHVRRWGDGIPVVMIHGSMSTGATTWAPQKPLADQGYRLVVPDRRGYGRSPGEGEDFAVDAKDAATLLGDGAHLVGHSYGGVAALLAATDRPDAVWSLPVTEPAAFSVAADDEAVRELLDAHQALWAEAETLDDRTFMERFITVMGTRPERIPDRLLDVWEQRTRPMRLGRPSWEAELDLDLLAGARIPTLVVSGNHSPAFEHVCDVVEERLGAERLVLAGNGHEVQRDAGPFNAALLEHWRATTPRRGRAGARPEPYPRR